MYELTTDLETLALQSVAEMPTLGRHRHHHRRRSYGRSACLVTGNNSLNGISILNILNFFG